MRPIDAQFEPPLLERALSSGGETGALIRSLDWSKTPCGPIWSWPPSLCNTVSLCLGSGIPITFGWGPEFVQFYNDAAIPLLRDKHPWAMGRPYAEVLPETADIIVPYGQRVMTTGEPVTIEDAKLFLNRQGRLQSAYFTFCFSAVRDESGAIVGIFNTFIETTGRVLGERRLRTLRELDVRSAQARSTQEACSRAAEVLAMNRSDLAFALLYLGEAEGASASLVGAMGLAPGIPAAPRTLALDGGGRPVWPLARVARSGRAELVTDLVERFGELCEPGQMAPYLALVLPAARTAEAQCQAFLVAGINPHRPLDEEARSFMQLVAASIGAGVANARARQDARERAERLAEIDRAKTTFVSNVSHEFRTPITLILSPVEDLLSDPDAALTPSQREQVATVRRNALRLLRLVNDLLTFTRLEAGRVDAFYEPVDLASLTQQLVAMFQPAAGRIGLRLTAHCPPLPEPIYVDPELWEKIVLNLLSNALKFTFEGEIDVSLHALANRVELAVRDTGVGIPAAELSHVFERFHRVRGRRARTHEGAGIGLSLLRELARLHGGDVRVESVEGQGTTFIVSIPRGSAHLPKERIGAPRPTPPPEVAAYVEETERWTAAAGRQLPAVVRSPESARPRLLVVEDNADMRDYLERLLQERYEVVTASDGATALATASANPPEVVLSDVMMPGLDGLELVSRLRQDPRTRMMPIVLLSARAAEEFALEGLSRGADDYVVKPFSSRELCARIDTHLELARIRHELGELKLKGEFMAIVAHELATPLTSMKLMFQLARSRLEEAGLPEATLLAGLDRAMTRLQRLIDDLTAVSLIKDDQLPLTIVPSDLVTICRRAAEEQATATQRDITVETPDVEVEARIDPDAIGHVVSNLLANALKFSAPHKPVVLMMRCADGEAIIGVRDEGPGIPARELPQLFQQFYRVPGIEVRSGSKIGFGVGLYICKAIVQLHGGRIWAESALGRGSTFWFALPLSA